MMELDDIEGRRLAIQRDLDGKKARVERNKLGQFATPTMLATDILQYARSLLTAGTELRFF